MSTAKFIIYTLVFILFQTAHCNAMTSKCWANNMNMFIFQIQQMLAQKLEKIAQQMLAFAANDPTNVG